MSADKVPDGDRSMEERLARLQAEIEEYRRRSGELRLALETLTTIDHVTGARNRSGILQSIESALQWNMREGTPFGVMALRVRGLTQIVSNESGEIAEEAMAHTAASISAGLRAVDRVGRAADDLFVLVLAKLEEEGVAVVARRVASVLSAVPFRSPTGEYPLAPTVACALVGAGARVDADSILQRLENMAGSDDPSSPELIHFGDTA